MSKLTFSQNLEDVLLWRAFQAVERGFYIDVGAWSPDMDSVTRLFYEAGWSGVNIEPNAGLLDAFLRKRPRDINLGVAVADFDGTADFFIPKNTGLSSLHRTWAERSLEPGAEAAQVEVTVRSLDSVWSEYVKAGQDVHFLKVDVEGAEREVLQGANFAKNRPWVVVVEATEPMSETPSHAAWESILLTNGYSFLWFDGLNRYYAANEHGELRRHFQVQPNVFDGFHLAMGSELSWLREREGELVGAVESLSFEVLGLREREAELDEELGRVHAANHYHFVEGEGLKARLAEIEQTLSWKLTTPLRGTANASRAIRAAFVTFAKNAVFSSRLHRLAVKVPWLVAVARKTLSVVSGWPLLGGFAVLLSRLLSESNAIHYRGSFDDQSDAMSIGALEILEILSYRKTTG